MRSADLRLLLIGGLVGLPSTAQASHARGMEGPLRAGIEAISSLFDRLTGRDLQDPVPQAIAGAADSPVVDLSDLADALSLEQTLRRAADGRDVPAVTVRNGRAFLGDFGIGTLDTLDTSLLVVRGTANVFGTLTGNLVTLDGDIVVHPGGTLLGEALALGGAVRDAGAGIRGGVRAFSEQTAPAGSALEAPSGFLVRAAGLAGVFLTLLAIGFGLVTFARPPLEIVSDTVAHSLGRSFVVGVLAQMLVLPTLGMLVVGLVLTVVGALLVPFAVAAFALLFLAAAGMGILAVAHAMGENRARRKMAMGVALSPNSYRYIATGLGGLSIVWLVWLLFGWVPFAGTLVLTASVLVSWILATVGFGASLLSRIGMRPDFAGRIIPQEALTDEYLWATPQFGVPAVQRPTKDDRKS